MRVTGCNKKGKSEMSMEITKQVDGACAQEIEEEQVKCHKIMELKPDLTFTEKGILGVLHVVLWCCCGFPRLTYEDNISCTTCVTTSELSLPLLESSLHQVVIKALRLSERAPVFSKAYPSP